MDKTDAASPSEDELQDFDGLWDYANPEATEAKFRTRLSAAHREGARADYAAQLLSQIARTLALQQRFDEAHTVLDEAETLITPDCVLAPVRCRIERGHIDTTEEAGA